MNNSSSNSHSTFAPGDVCVVVVESIEAFGLFVRLSHGEIGLIATHHLAWVKDKSSHSKFFAGQQLVTVVVGFDDRLSQIGLSVKELLPDPFREFARSSFMTTISGAVTKSTPIGSFISVAPGIEGLVPAADLIKVGRTLLPGAEVAVRVVAINLEHRRIRLSLIHPVADDSFSY